MVKAHAWGRHWLAFSDGKMTATALFIAQLTALNISFKCQLKGVVCSFSKLNPVLKSHNNIRQEVRRLHVSAARCSRRVSAMVNSDDALLRKRLKRRALARVLKIKHVCPSRLCHSRSHKLEVHTGRCASLGFWQEPQARKQRHFTQSQSHTMGNIQKGVAVRAK